MGDGGTETVAAESVYTGFAVGTTSRQQHVAVKDPAEINVEAEEQEFEENALNEQIAKCSDDKECEATVPPLRRSYREKRPQKMSLWVVTKAAKRQRKDKMDADEIEAFYNMIDRSCIIAEANV